MQREVDQEHLGIWSKIPTTSGSPRLWYCSIKYQENPLSYTRQQSRSIMHEVPIQDGALTVEKTSNRKNRGACRRCKLVSSTATAGTILCDVPQMNIFVLQWNMSTNTRNLVHCLRSISRTKTLLVSCIQTIQKGRGCYRKEGDASYWHSASQESFRRFTIVNAYTDSISQRRTSSSNNLLLWALTYIDI